MKGVMLVLSLLVVLGVLYGLALAGVLPAQKWADKSPALAKPLIALHLAKKSKKSARVVKKDSTTAPQPAPTGEQEQVAAERAQLDKDRAAFEAEKQAAAPSPGTGGATTPSPSAAGGPSGGPAPDTAAKLVAIYDTMSPDDVARIFGKLPDAQVIPILMQLDEKKDGRILAALPPDRAARINLLMAHGPTRTASAAPPPHPLTAIP